MPGYVYTHLLSQQWRFKKLACASLSSFESSFEIAPKLASGFGRPEYELTIAER